MALARLLAMTQTPLNHCIEHQPLIIYITVVMVAKGQAYLNYSPNDKPTQLPPPPKNRNLNNYAKDHYSRPSKIYFLRARHPPCFGANMAPMKQPISTLLLLLPSHSSGNDPFRLFTGNLYSSLTSLLQYQR